MSASLFTLRRQEADRWREKARECEREARRLRQFAAKIEDPPKGTTVELLGHGSVRFVTTQAEITRTLRA